MDRKCASSGGASSLCKPPLAITTAVLEKAKSEKQRGVTDDDDVDSNIEIDLREVYFLIMQFLSAGPCQRTFEQLLNELLEHQLLPRRYHAWFSRAGAQCGNENDDGISFPLSYNKLVERYPHIHKDHMVKLLKQLISKVGGDARAPNAANVPTLLGFGSFSLLDCDRSMKNRQGKSMPVYLRWPHMQADQVHGLSLREIGGGFTKHHRASSIRSACYAIAKPSTMVQKMQNIKRLRGHRNAVYCAIFDRSGRYVITGSDDRLVKIWSMETAFCLASCRGHEGDITDLAVSSNNALVASASNDFVIRVWRLPDGMPISVLRGHTGAVTAIAFSPRPGFVYQLLSSSDDGTCRIWDARSSQFSPRIYLPKPSNTTVTGKSNHPPNNGPSTSNVPQNHQILCCAYNANGTVFVTGSSDTFARVWSACKANTDDSELPIHELDVLAGHENDVNYVQFSGCAVPSRSSMSDSIKEENLPKFKNSWFCHDNIVTCSRDGSAIIWIPKSRRSHGKFGRWMKAYHLKVPPPPLPPQPPRGGPRQRFLPTPRGVNMIVWSLDNRFVLAAIMDCRICVWNAVDGSLVHSLTGHTLSSYVLDVHPFNPRIAMSAGYDGKTIIWDIWEGVPIRIYDIGRFKLVDGKFSPDGTSIVLSDEVGQIYFLNTGQGEYQQDAKYDQFFLGDYRPLIRDAAGNVLDQETQLPPHRRNIQDLLCDSSLVPYPEPYQSMYQKRRLGALGIEWRPSSIKFAVGPDISLGQDFEMPPLEDLERMIEPLPEFIDAMYWEPENEAVSDDNDSEYNVAEECSTEGEQGTLSSNSSGDDTEHSVEDSEVDRSNKDGRRKPRRRKHENEVEIMTSSGRRAKKRYLNERDDSLSGSNRNKRSKNGKRASNRKSSKAKSLRPQRLAARNARNILSKITTSTDGDDDVDSEDDSSNSESMLEDSSILSSSTSRNLEKAQHYSSFKSKDVVKPCELPESQSNIVKRKRLVLKFSLREKPEPLEDTRLSRDDQADLCPLPCGPQETIEGNAIVSGSKVSGLSCSEAIDVDMSNQDKTDLMDGKPAVNTEYSFEESAGKMDKSIKSGQVKLRTSANPTTDVIPTDASTGFRGELDVHGTNMMDENREEEQVGTGGLQDPDSVKMEEFALPDGIRKPLTSGSPPLGDHQSKGSSSMFLFTGSLSKGNIDCSGSRKSKNDGSPQTDELSGSNQYQESRENAPIKLMKLRIRTKANLRDLGSPSHPRSITIGHDLTNRGGDIMSTSYNYRYPRVQEEDECSDRLSSPQVLDSGLKLNLNDAAYERENPYEDSIDPDGFDPAIKENALNAVNNHDLGNDYTEAATDAIRRTRTMKKVSKQHPDSWDHGSKVQVDHGSEETSEIPGNSSLKAGDRLISGGWMSGSKVTVRSRSTRKVRGGHHENHSSFSIGRKSNYPVRKLSWLMLSEPEEGCRYIPQLGDDVVYFRQGHEEFIESSRIRGSGPWSLTKGYLSAVEVCKVEKLTYANFPGSGDACCKMILRFIDPSSGVFGEAFELTLPELIGFPDFLIEKERYDAAMRREWTHRDKCQVWWKNDNGEGGTWWEGRIVSVRAKSMEFPDSPWERYEVRYKDGGTYHHSAWELFDPNILWEPPHIDPEVKDKLLSSFAKLEHSMSRNQDYYGIWKFNESAQKLEFLNRFPVPLYPDLIQSRLENNYYRTLEGVENDMTVMLANAKAYFAKNAQMSSKIRHLSDWFTKTLSKL